MGAAGLRQSADDAEALLVRPASEPFFDLEIGASRRAQGVNRLLQPDRRRHVRALPGERRVNRARFPIRPAPDNCEVFFRDSLLLHEQAKTPRGGRVFRHEDEAARLAIEPVDDRNLAAVRDLKCEELFQFAPKRPNSARFRGVHQEERRLFHHDEVFTFRDDGEIMTSVCVRSIRGG